MHPVRLLSSVDVDGERVVAAMCEVPVRIDKLGRTQTFVPEWDCEPDGEPENDEESVRTAAEREDSDKTGRHRLADGMEYA